MVQPATKLGKLPDTVSGQYSLWAPTDLGLHDSVRSPAPEPVASQLRSPEFVFTSPLCRKDVRRS